MSTTPKKDKDPKSRRLRSPTEQLSLNNSSSSQMHFMSKNNINNAQKEFSVESFVFPSMLPEFSVNPFDFTSPEPQAQRQPLLQEPSVNAFVFASPEPQAQRQLKQKQIFCTQCNRKFKTGCGLSSHLRWHARKKSKRNAQKRMSAEKGKRKETGGDEKLTQSTEMITKLTETWIMLSIGKTTS